MLNQLICKITKQNGPRGSQKKIKSLHYTNCTTWYSGHTNNISVAQVSPNNKMSWHLYEIIRA